jgi:15-cis-phytoene synthase
MSAAVVDAFATTTAITRTEARNFYYGIRLLSPAKRDALCALYSLARRIDDIGDGDLPAKQKLAQLAELTGQLDRLGSTVPDDPVLLAVTDVCARFPVPLAAFYELISGVELDVRGSRYDSFDELVHYCRCVAGSIGRLCLGVFGHTGGPVAVEYADTLGIALQQINILRDIREDLRAGRIYLPAEDLARFAVQLELDADGRLVDADGRLTELIRFSADRAARWYSSGERLLPLLDRRSRSCCAAMAGIYRQLLTRIGNKPELVFGSRLSLSGAEKGRIAVRSILGGGAR